MLQLHQSYFTEHEGKLAVYHTKNPWMTEKSRKSRPVRIKKAYGKFVRFAVINHLGQELYGECCNYFSIDDGDDRFEFVE